MKKYDDELVPKSGWHRLEQCHGRTHSPELWLAGKQLPKIFKRYQEKSKRRLTTKQASSRCNLFVADVLRYAGIKTKKNKEYDADTVAKYRVRAAKPEGFELTDRLD